MEWLRVLMSRVSSLFWRGRLDAELDEELQAHVELAVAENMRRGMTADEAHTAALRDFGGVTQARESYRMQRGLPFLEIFLRDLHLALRQLLKSPGFAVTAILTVALGVGANTAIFTLVHAVMLKSLPVTEPERIYRVGDNNKCCTWNGTMDDWSIYSYALYSYLRDHTPAFEEVAAFSTVNPALSVRRSNAGAPENAMSSHVEPGYALTSEFVSGNYFSMFGLQAYAGRLFSAADDTPGAPPAVVMSYHAWREHFGSDASNLGTVVVNGSPFTVVGIAPPDFFGDRLTNDPPDLWIPINQERVIRPHDSYLHLPDTHWLYMMGRAGNNFDPAAVQSQLTLEIQQWLRGEANLSASDKRDIPRQRVRLSPGGGGIAGLRDYYSKGLYLLTAISALVLLIACANLANLLLVREASRRRQTLICVALGAPRRRILRAVLSESILLALLGGVAGLLLAYLGTRAILLLAFGDIKNLPIPDTPSLPVVAFALAVSLVTGIVFGIIPAWMTSRSDPADALRGTHRATRGRVSLSQKSLIVVQAALSLVLLTLGGLLTRSLSTLESQPLGFETDHRVSVHVYPQTAGYEPARLETLYRELKERLGRVPGVLQVGLASYGPQEGCCWNSGLNFQDPTADATQGKTASWLRTNADYFRVLGTPLMQGRLMREQDTATSPPVVVVDEAFAHKFFPSRDPIGQHFGMGGIAGHAADYEIVGVVRNAQYDSVTNTQNPMFFLPLNQSIHFASPSYERTEMASLYIGEIELHVAGNASGSATNLEAEVRRAIASIDPDLMVFRFLSVKDQVALTFSQQRLIARLTGLFSLLALALASVGLYGVTAYSVAERTDEIGIRMALGADRSRVISMVIRSSLMQVAVGIVVGVPFALIGGNLIASQLYKTKPYDPAVLIGTVLLLCISALIAGFLPARRAASVDPMRALRTE